MFCEKRFLSKFRKIHRKLRPRGSTWEICKIFKNAFFTERLRTTVSKSGYCNNEARDIDCICCRELDAMLIASAKISDGKGRTSPSSFHEHLPDY